MSSPRGFDAGGIGWMGTDELRRLAPGAGEGDGLRRRGVCGVVGEDGDAGGSGDCGRAKRNAKGLKGSLERSGGWRTLRYMLKFRRARLACGTYLCPTDATRDNPDVSTQAGSSAYTLVGKEEGDYALVRITNLLRVHSACEEQDERRHTDEEQARRKVRMHPHVRIVGIYLRECLMEDPFVREAEPVGLEEDLTEKEGDDEQ